MKLLIATIIFSYLVIIAVWLIDKRREFKGPVGREKFWPYRKKDFLLTQQEKRLFHILDKSIGDKYYVFIKVRLRDMLYLENKHIKNKKLNRRWLIDQIRPKHVDYLIATKLNIRPLLVIELDADYKKAPGHKVRDDFLNEILEDVNLPLLRVKAKYYYDKKVIKNDIMKLIRKKERGHKNP